MNHTHTRTDDVVVLLVLTEQNIQRGFSKHAMFRDADGYRIELFDDIDDGYIGLRYPKIRRAHLEPASCCLLGGLVLAAHDSGASDEVYVAAQQQLRKIAINSRFSTIIDFNDAASTTKEQAIDLVRSARLALLKG